MRLPNRNTICSLERRLSTLFRETSLKEWVENSVSRLLHLSNQSYPPTNFSKELYKHRRIESIKYVSDIKPFWGRLKIADKGFEIELFPPKKTSVFWARYSLAHEIAHTFFYNIKNWPPKPLVYIEPRDIELEWLCDFIAKSLFVPFAWLNEELNKIPPFYDKNFSFNPIFNLKRKFKTPIQIILERIVEDLDLWNCVILQFTKISPEFVSDEEKNENKDEWRLTWHTLPLKGTDKLFIPRGRAKEGGRRVYPRAKGNILKFIEECVRGSNNDSGYAFKVHNSMISSQTTGNLGKFLSHTHKADMVDVYIFHIDVSQANLFNPQKKYEESLFVAFPS